MSSKSKSFSEFLVEQGAITAEQLVDLLINQAQNQPTTLELVRKRGLLSPSQILWAIAHQMKSPEPCDFTTACRQLGYWTSEMTEALSSEQARVRVPLADLLLKSESITNDKLVHFLDLYLSDVQAPVAVSPAVAPTPVTAPRESGDDNHFHELYSPSTQSELISCANSWKGDDQSSKVLLERIHSLVGAARFSKLGDLESIFKEAEASVKGAADLPQPITDGLLQALRDDLLQLIDRAWSARERSVA